jgi:hypothetical protein
MPDHNDTLEIRMLDLTNYRPPSREELSAKWGGWRLEGLWLSYPAYGKGRGRSGYPINLERFTSSAQMLDMIMQVAKKGWATDECLSGLVHALNDILHPQAYLCSFGRDKRLTEEEIRELAR